MQRYLKDIFTVIDELRCGSPYTQADTMPPETQLGHLHLVLSSIFFCPLHNAIGKDLK